MCFFSDSGRVKIGMLYTLGKTKREMREGSSEKHRGEKGRCDEHLRCRQTRRHNTLLAAMARSVAMAFVKFLARKEKNVEGLRHKRKERASAPPRQWCSRMRLQWRAIRERNAERGSERMIQERRGFWFDTD